MDALGIMDGGGRESSPGNGPCLAGLGGGSSHLFSFTFSDGDGAADLVWAQVIIGSNANLAGVCYFAYNREHNLLFLENDAGTGATGLAPAGFGSLQNSQCTLYLADFSAVSAGNTLTITLPITFSAAFGGARNVYLYASDRAGLGSGWQSRGTWTVRPGTQPPVIQSVTPSAGTGASQTFSFVVSDADGPAQLVWVHGLINTSIDPARACYFAYNPYHKLLFLQNDAGTYSTGLRLGSSWILENSQCTVSPAASSASLTGTTLTLNVAVTFKPAFTGPKNLYVYGLDIDGSGTGWQLRGTWTW